MKISVLTYNICFNKALTGLNRILQSQRPYICCLQEVDTTNGFLDNFKLDNLLLADYTNSFWTLGRIFGQTTFFNPEKFRLIDSSNFDLPRSFYETLLIIIRGFNNPRTILKNTFLHLKSNQKITVYNVHLSALLMASNGKRYQQIEETLADLKITKHEKAIITGDFNYSFRRKKFESLIQQYGLKEATNNLTFTSSYFRFFKLKLDYILYKGLTCVQNRRLPVEGSDHYPIFCEFTI